ncbi:MAG: isocitrate/isopropylmalate dehydrogenase family protein [Candidatus Bathyarchaeia archaeon]
MKDTYRIAIIEGDGIGPDIVREARRVLDSVQDKFGFRLKYVEAPMGDRVKEATGEAVPKKSLETFLESDAGLKGPVGESTRDLVQALRFNLDLYANIRPAKSYSTITPPALRPDIDMIVVRENTEGLYRAMEDEVIPGVWTTTGVYTEKACERITRLSFDLAKNRLGKGGKGEVVLAHKANIFRKTHGMFREIFRKVGGEYPEVKARDLYADAVCALLVKEPQRFDVIVAENLIADLLSDLAGQIAGGLGMTAATNFNPERGIGYFEPTHGCAYDIAGTNKANPIGQISSAGLMLEFLGTHHKDKRLLEAAHSVELAIERYLKSSGRSELPIELGGRADTRMVGERISKLIV